MHTQSNDTAWVWRVTNQWDKSEMRTQGNKTRAWYNSPPHPPTHSPRVTVSWAASQDDIPVLCDFSNNKRQLESNRPKGSREGQDDPVSCAIHSSLAPVPKVHTVESYLQKEKETSGKM